MKKILNAWQAAKVRQINTGGTFFTLPVNKALIDGYMPFKNECDEYDINFDLLKSIIPKKDYDEIIGITSNKTDSKEIIADDLETMAHQVLAYCTKENKVTLAASFHFSQWDIIALKQEEILPLVTRISKLLTPLLTDVKFMEYQVTSIMLSALMAKAVTYNADLGTSETTTNEMGTVNVSINQVIRTMLAEQRQMRLLNAYFKKSQPEFYADLIKNTRPQYPATRATGIQGRVLNKLGKGIPGLVVRIINTEFSAITDADGYYIIIKLPAGTYTLQTSNEGGDSDLHEVTVSYRHIETQDFSL